MQPKNLLTKKRYNPAYHKAFVDYLRYGITITVPYYKIETKSLTEFYIWCTRKDFKVRPTHAANEGKIFEWNKPPPTGHPGQAPYCRCWAEAVIASFQVEYEPFIRMNDIKTWPKPPIDGILTEGVPSKTKYRNRGEKSLYDEYGGEWRPHIEDKRHNLHWDYKSSSKYAEWLNIPINNLPTRK